MQVRKLLTCYLAGARDMLVKRNCERAGLAGVVGVPIATTHECRREVEAHINLHKLVVLATTQRERQL